MSALALRRFGLGQAAEAVMPHPLASARGHRRAYRLLAAVQRCVIDVRQLRSMSLPVWNRSSNSGQEIRARRLAILGIPVR